MSFTERVEVFDCEGDTLIGIAALPDSAGSRGVLVIVGGPQYRVGSHRQFTLLSRRLAEEGYPVFRFDWRGMGDSSGIRCDFEHVHQDIRAAVDCFLVCVPDVREVVLWGLCDAASAAMMYAPTDLRVKGLVLLNPWARNASTIAKTRIKHYYTARLVQRQLWLKIAKGEFDWRNVLWSLADTVRAALQPRPGGHELAVPFQTRMARGLRQFDGRSLLLLSGNDLTAREFLEYAASDPEWRGVIDSPKTGRRDFPEADHTFSAGAWRKAVEDATLEWLAAL